MKVVHMIKKTKIGFLQGEIKQNIWQSKQAIQMCHQLCPPTHLKQSLLMTWHTFFSDRVKKI